MWVPHLPLPLHRSVVTRGTEPTTFPVLRAEIIALFFFFFSFPVSFPISYLLVYVGEEFFWPPLLFWCIASFLCCVPTCRLHPIDKATGVGKTRNVRYRKCYAMWLNKDMMQRPGPQWFDIETGTTRISSTWLCRRSAFNGGFGAVNKRRQ